MNRLVITLIVYCGLASLSASQDQNARGRSLQQLQLTFESSESIKERFESLDQYVDQAPQADGISLLVSALDDRSPDIRGLAARKLGEAGRSASSAVDPLIKTLADVEYRWHWISLDFATQRAVRYDAAEALGRIGPASRDAVKTLTEMAQTDEDPEVRVSAALALLRIEPHKDDPLKLLVASLSDDERGTAGPKCAAEALLQLGPKARSAIPTLVSATEHRDEFLRMAAVDALVAVGGKDAVPTLVRCLTDEDSQVREAACEALGSLGPHAASAVPQLIRVLVHDSDELYFVQTSAARALGEIGPSAAAAIPHLERLADESLDESMHTVVENALRKIRGKSVDGHSDQ
jgi:HEAT repeat protein